MRELTTDEIDFVSGGNWYDDLVEAVRSMLSRGGGYITTQNYTAADGTDTYVGTYHRNSPGAQEIYCSATMNAGRGIGAAVGSNLGAGVVTIGATTWDVAIAVGSDGLATPVVVATYPAQVAAATAAGVVGGAVGGAVGNKVAGSLTGCHYEQQK